MDISFLSLTLTLITIQNVVERLRLSHFQKKQYMDVRSVAKIIDNSFIIFLVMTYINSYINNNMVLGFLIYELVITHLYSVIYINTPWEFYTRNIIELYTTYTNGYNIVYLIRSFYPILIFVFYVLSKSGVGDVRSKTIVSYLNIVFRVFIISYFSFIVLSSFVSFDILHAIIMSVYAFIIIGRYDNYNLRFS